MKHPNPKLFKLGLKEKWKWWHWFIPSRRKERKYLKKVEVIMNEFVEADLKKNRKQVEKHFENVTIYGVCDGSCGWKVGHGIYEEGESKN